METVRAAARRRSEDTVSSLVDMFLRVSDAILFKEFVHVRGDCREVNDLVASDPCAESWCRVCRLGLKGNEFHSVLFKVIAAPCSSDWVVLIIR